jgi:hypothetical protein
VLRFVGRAAGFSPEGYHKQHGYFKNIIQGSQGIHRVSQPGVLEHHNAAPARERGPGSDCHGVSLIDGGGIPKAGIRDNVIYKRL